MVVDRHVYAFPSDAPRSLAAITSDAMAHPSNAAEPLDVEVKKVAGSFVLITNDRLWWLKVAETRQAVPLQDR